MPGGPVWLSLWTAQDEVVTPPDSARLAGALGIELQDVCADARISHGQLPTDPLVVGLVERALALEPLTEQPSATDCRRLRVDGGALLGG